MRPLLLLPFLLLTACGHIGHANQKARAAARERELKKLNAAATSEADNRLGEKAVGEVVRVDANGEFVLVRVRAGLVLAAEQELECRGTGGGRIKITPERKSVFVAADVLKGTPAVGDTVIPIKGTGRPKLVPVVAQGTDASGNPANTLYLNPGDLRAEDMPNSTLSDPGARRLPSLEEPAPRDDVGGNLLLEPPLPQKEPPLLPVPELPQ